MVVRLSCSFVNVAVENYFRKSSLHRQSFVKSPFSNSKFPFMCSRVSKYIVRILCIRIFINLLPTNGVKSVFNDSIH